jgi:hypothetical protein
VAGEAVSEVSFTGDSLEIRLSGWNEYTTDNFEFFRTTLAGVVIEYGLDGDHNSDGAVDAADYVFWRDTMGDIERYNEWKENFGAIQGTGAGATIPEPTTFSLLLVALVALVAIRSRFCLWN